MQKHIPPLARPHVMTLVVAAASSALAMNVFLPSLPAMARYFETDYSVMQLAVGLYLVATAVLQLVIGPASDRFGRRPVMLACFAIFLVSTFAAIFATSIHFLLACRLMQAFSAAGMVLSRAVIRDLYGPEESASKIGYVTMGMALVPMVAPVIGGFLDELYGWQATFALTLAFGTMAFIVIWSNLSETNHHKSSSLLAQVRTYPELLGARRFWGYTLTAAFTSGTFFAFLGGGPFVASEILHLSPSQYGFYFAFISLGYVSGNFLSGRFSTHIGLNRMMLTGNAVSAAGMLVPLALLQFGYLHPIAVFGPAIFVGLGNGMALPNAMAGLVSVRPHLAGSASGLGGSMQMGGGAVLSVIAGAVLSAESGPAPLFLLMFLTSCAGIASTLYVIRIAATAAPLPDSTDGS